MIKRFYFKQFVDLKDKGDLLFVFLVLVAFYRTPFGTPLPWQKKKRKRLVLVNNFNNKVSFLFFFYTQLNVKTVLFQVIQFSINSLNVKQFHLTHRQVLPLRASWDQRAMTMKWYPAFSKAPALLKHDHQIVLHHILDTGRRSFTPFQRCSRCILQPQPIGTCTQCSKTRS